MSGFEHSELNIQWQEVLEVISGNFGDVDDVKDVVFLIGVQELGQGFRTFSKDEKIDLMHIGLCTILSRYGYYSFEGRDSDGWPHWKAEKTLPALSEKEREWLLKEAVITYFKESSLPSGRDEH